MRDLFAWSRYALRKAARAVHKAEISRRQAPMGQGRATVRRWARDARLAARARWTRLRMTLDRPYWTVLWNRCSIDARTVVFRLSIMQSLWAELKRQRTAPQFADLAPEARRVSWIDRLRQAWEWFVGLIKSPWGLGQPKGATI